MKFLGFLIALLSPQTGKGWESRKWSVPTFPTILDIKEKQLSCYLISKDKLIVN